MRTIIIICSLLLVSLGLPVAADSFPDPLDTPAQISTLATESHLNGIASLESGELVAVGRRGHILRSEDGEAWTQVASPVSVDLTNVFFVDGQRGWIVGHDGVVMRSDDGGRSWKKQLDGRKANSIMLSFYEKRAEQGESLARELLPEIKRMVDAGPVLPFLDVWFRDRNEGYISGAFNLIFHTRDGGESWTPLYHLTENPRASHLYGIQGVGDELFVAGELGLVLKLDDETDRLVSLDVGYDGSFFGLLADNERVVVFGLRGHAFESRDEGATWRQVDTGTNQSITSGRWLSGGRLMFGTLAGQLLVESPSREFQACAARGLGGLASFSVPGSKEGSNPAVLVGFRGVKKVQCDDSLKIRAVKSKQRGPEHE